LSLPLSFGAGFVSADGGGVLGSDQVVRWALSSLSAGATQFVTLSFTVLSGSQTPASGSLITLVVSDQVHGASVSHSVEVNHTLAMLSPPVAPLGNLDRKFGGQPWGWWRTAGEHIKTV
jgi:hypothetical protein